MILAGIGSRETPEHILREMTIFGSMCRDRKVIVRSGHADGADYAFEQGSREYTEVFIPWRNFNRKSPYLGRVILPVITDLHDAYVKTYHPTPDRLKPGAYMLMARNSCQVMGEHLNDPVDAVVCWTRDGKALGGTGQAIRIAMDHQIPILNMFNREFDTALKVMDYLLLNLEEFRRWIRN